MACRQENVPSQGAREGARQDEAESWEPGEVEGAPEPCQRHTVKIGILYLVQVELSLNWWHFRGVLARSRLFWWDADAAGSGLHPRPRF